MHTPWVHTSPAQQVHVGAGAIGSMGEVLKALGIRRALLVTTEGRAASDGGRRVQKAIGRALADTLDTVVPHVPTTVVQEAAASARRVGADGLVSLGGGSAVDTAKAVGFVLEREAGTPGAGFADRPALPHVAVPTTLAGAAYTGRFALLDPGSRRSSVAEGPTMVPSAVLVDAEMTADLDGPDLAGSIAMAIAHAVETMWSPQSTPEALALAEAGLRAIVAAGPAAVAEPGDIERRATLVDAAVLCGRSRQSVGDGLHHALAHLIAARAGVSAGAVHAALLPGTARFTFDVVDQVAERVAAALGEPGHDPTDVLVGLLGRMATPVGLAELGVDDETLDAVARQAGGHRGVQRHPRPAGEADVRALLDDAC
ncbi:MAG: iron-containing alcohol dehydrogenase family protein [Acidimicrobiales bacterium]